MDPDTKMKLSTIMMANSTISGLILLSNYQDPVLTENAQVSFIATVTNGFLIHILELASMLLICFDFLQK